MVIVVCMGQPEQDSYRELLASPPADLLVYDDFRPQVESGLERLYGVIAQHATELGPLGDMSEEQMALRGLFNLAEGRYDDMVRAEHIAGSWQHTQDVSLPALLGEDWNISDMPEPTFTLSASVEALGVIPRDMEYKGIVGDSKVIREAREAIAERIHVRRRSSTTILSPHAQLLGVPGVRPGWRRRYDYSDAATIAQLGEAVGDVLLSATKTLAAGRVRLDAMHGKSWALGLNSYDLVAVKAGPKDVLRGYKTTISDPIEASAAHFRLLRVLMSPLILRA